MFSTLIISSEIPLNQNNNKKSGSYRLKNETMKMKLISALMCLSVFMCMAKEGKCEDHELKNYCSNHTFENLPVGGLRFTKEVVTSEYANVGSFKAITCCLRGYRSIEWYKNGRAYPWPESESQFILYPDSANQTIYTSIVRQSDAGRYTCKANNDTVTLTGEITLTVLGEGSGVYTGRPLPTYRPSSQLVPIGGTARLFCEAYIGKAYVPDARNSVTWWRSDSNATLGSHGRISQHKVSRESEQIVGSYLVIKDVTHKDYGEYVCQVSNGIDDEIIFIAHLYHQEPQFTLGLNNGSWHKPLFLTLLLLVLLCSAIAFYARCWMPVALYCRDKFAPLEENDGKTSDALICYNEKDSGFVLGTVVPTLQSKYRYKCSSLELSSMTQNWPVEMGPHAQLARRTIVILSPEAMNQCWNQQAIQKVFDYLAAMENQRTIVLALQDAPMPFFSIFPALKKKDKNKDVEQGYATKSGNFVTPLSLTILHWREKEIQNFWWRLRLAMPPSRPTQENRNATMIVQPNNRTAQQRADSKEGLEVLV